MTTVLQSQVFECTILNVDGNKVGMNARDLTNSNCADEYIEITLDKFDKDERSSVNAGTVFYWTIEYQQIGLGIVKTVSKFRLYKMPKMSVPQLRQIDIRARELASILNFELDQK